MKNKMNTVYDYISDFKKRYPRTIAWRMKKHAKVIETHLNPGEIIKYGFVAQKNDNPFDIITTNAIVLTNKRILIASKRLVFGYFFTAITPDMFNDLQVRMGIIWGKIAIDTVKEEVVLSNIDPRALDEIETRVTEYMMEEKQKYALKN